MSSTRGLGLVIYGTEGVGKTSFALQFKKEILFISVKETGFLDLQDMGEVPDNCDHKEAKSWIELLKLVKTGADYSTVVIDSLSGVQQLMANDIIPTIYSDKSNPKEAFGSFSEGYRIHGPIWIEKLTNELDILRSNNINCILIGHAKHEITKNSFGPDFISTELDMEKWPRAVITKWAQAVLYMTLDQEVMITKTWKGKPTEAKISQELESASDRIMYTSKHPSHSAKNRLNLPVFIMMGESPQEAYKNFFSKLPGPIQEAQGK